MKHVTVRDVLIIVLAIALVFALHGNQSTAVYNPDIQQVSLGNSPKAQSYTVQLQPGDSIVVNCPTRLIARQTSSRRASATCLSSQSTAQPTATKVITATPTLTLTAPSTSTESPHETATPMAGLQAWEVWHAPGAHVLPDGSMSKNHEHGHPVPVWVDEFSQENFGHPLIYGGDERSSQTEVTHKHEAYTNVLLDFNPNGCKTDFFLRFHASSTPADRSTPLHSFEVYVRDCAGNITFNQGVYWAGDPNELAQRMCHSDQLAGSITYDGRVAPGRDQYIIASRCQVNEPFSDTWYVHFPVWDFGITLLNATTFFSYGEHLNDPMNHDTWKLTGQNELTLRFEITSLPHPYVSLPFSVPQNRWWCIQHIPTIGTRSINGQTLPFPDWLHTGAVASPADCPAGYLPQYNASTMPIFNFEMDGTNVIERVFMPGADIVEVPN